MPTYSSTSLAAILWSGMLVIAGSIWVLCSQVSKLVELLENRAEPEATGRRVGARIPRQTARSSDRRASTRGVRAPRVAVGRAPAARTKSRKGQAAHLGAIVG